MRRKVYIDEMKPKVKGRPRVTKRGTYTPKNTVEYEKAVAEAWAEVWPHPVDCPVGVDIEIGSNYIDIEVYELVEARRPKGLRGDIDNYQKAILDALNKVAFEDDALVHEAFVWFNND